MKYLFIYATRADMLSAGFHPGTHLALKDRQCRGLVLPEAIDQIHIFKEKLVGLHPDLVIIDSGCSPHRLTLVHSQWEEYKSLIEYMKAKLRRSTWIGNIPNWRQE